MVDDIDEQSDDSPTHEVDVVVIGGGPVGENVVDRAEGRPERRPRRVALLGGECSYFGVPSKALLRPGSALEGACTVDGPARPSPVRSTTRRACPPDAADRRLVRRRPARVAGRGEHRPRSGAWAPAGERTVVVDLADGGAVTIRAEHAVVVATGTSPLPPIPGPTEAAPWTNREATSADAAPSPPGRPGRRTGRLRAGHGVALARQRGGHDRRAQLPTAGPGRAVRRRGGRGRVEAQGVVVWTGAPATRVERPTPGGRCGSTSTAARATPSSRPTSCWWRPAAHRLGDIGLRGRRVGARLVARGRRHRP